MKKYIYVCVSHIRYCLKIEDATSVPSLRHSLPILVEKKFFIHNLSIDFVDATDNAIKMPKYIHAGFNSKSLFQKKIKS